MEIAAQYIARTKGWQKVYFQGDLGSVASCMFISCVNKYKGSQKKENKKNSIVNRLLLSLNKGCKGF